LIREDRHLRQSLREAYCAAGDPENNPGNYQAKPEAVELSNGVRVELEARAARHTGGLKAVIGG